MTTFFIVKVWADGSASDAMPATDRQLCAIAGVSPDHVHAARRGEVAIISEKGDQYFIATSRAALETALAEIL